MYSNCTLMEMFYSANKGHVSFLSIPFCLQNAVSKSALQYRGNSQHDAQEFLLWLLDRVHEDLNAVHPDSGPSIRVSPGIGSVVLCWESRYFHWLSQGLLKLLARIELNLQSMINKLLFV